MIHICKVIAMFNVNFSYENKLVGNGYPNTHNETYTSIERHGHIHTLHVRIETIIYTHL